MKMIFKRASIWLVLLGGLTACDVTPLKTMWALRNVDPLTTDPEQLRLAVRIPSGFHPQATGMALTATLNATADTAAEEQSYAIVPVAGARELAELAREGSTLHVFKLSEADLVRFRQFQHKARSRDASAPRGSVGVSAQVCRETAPLPETIPISVYLNTAEIGRFVPLFEDQDILEHADADQLNEIAPVCAS